MSLLVGCELHGGTGGRVVITSVCRQPWCVRNGRPCVVDALTNVHMLCDKLSVDVSVTTARVCLEYEFACLTSKYCQMHYAFRNFRSG